MMQFKTLLFLECIKNQYVNGFLEKGAIRFGLPSEWALVEEGRRGDCFEGAYALEKSPDTDTILKNLALRPRSTFKTKGDLTYFYSNEVRAMRTYCLYGLNDRDLVRNNKRSQDHRYHLSGKVTKQYFHNLYPQISKEKYQTLDQREKPMLLMICPDVFYQRLVAKLCSMGLRADEYIFSPVNYYDDYQKLPELPKPFELFWKSGEFVEQNEIRITITSSRPHIRELFEKNDGIIELGPMKDITTVSDYYFDDMQVEERGTKLFYSLATPLHYTIEKTIENHLAVIQMALSDELPQSPMSIKEIEDYIHPITILIKERFGANYNLSSHTVTMLDGTTFGFHSAAVKQLNHYNIYISENDLQGAKECIEKIRHFFPYINMEKLFSRSKDTDYSSISQ